MKLDLYKNAHSNSRTAEVGLTEFLQATESAEVAALIERFRAGDVNAKRQLPAVTYMGKSTTGKRRADDMQPTGLVMLDIDHADDRLQDLYLRCLEADFQNAVRPALIHITPSGKGLRIVFPMSNAWSDIADAQRSVVARFSLDAYGVFDEACKDLSRLSFLPQRRDVKFINGDLLFADYEPQPQASPAAEEAKSEGGEYSDFTYNDVPVRIIAEEYVKWKGEPKEGETHNFYNAMVADFRHICDNSPAILVDVLPLLGQTRANRKSQCDSICRRNCSTKIPTGFWFWLKKKGYWQAPQSEADENNPDDPFEAEHSMLDKMPTLPPVFREYVNAAPREFKLPTIFALLPVMGTLATYLQAEYYDGEMHTPSFFTIIYAPAGQGKSFINHFLDLDVYRSHPHNLMHDALKRDAVTEARTNLWLQFSNTKKDNEKGKNRPKTTTRILPAIFSQADFLPVMKDNQGMHMFCFAPEIDTLIKGMRAGGGGDKNDIFRIAWDNGTYGQSYRGTNSFRGKVALFLNVLSTGTPAQCAKLFTDVENGLVTRCSFTDLGNQDFAAYQPWKKLSQKDLKVIQAFRDRCDASTYVSALNFDINKLDEYDGDEERFDEEVPWQYQFRGRQTIDLDYINEVLLKWVDEQRLIAQKNCDLAHDAFRKRSAVKAFRVALLCHACWTKVGNRERKIIKDFALWFADLDLMKSLKRWGKEYNDKQSSMTLHVGKRYYDTLFDIIPKEFTARDVAVEAPKHSVQTPARKIISRWCKAGLVKKVTNDKYQKT